MIIDLRTLMRQGKESEEFFFEYIPEKDETEIPTIKIRTPIKVCGSVELTGNHSAYVQGEINCILFGECTRCLKETEKEFIFEFAEQLDTGEEQGYSVVNDKINLTKIVDDAIAMDTPVNFLCKEDCKGICTSCGTNLNDGDCKCEK